MKILKKYRVIVLALSLLVVGFLGGWFFAQRNGEDNMAFASFENVTVRGRDVLPRIQPELDQLEMSKYALKKRASEELLLERLPPEQRKLLIANRSEAAARALSQNTGESGEPSVSKEDIARFLKERSYDPARLGPADLESIAVHLRDEKRAALAAGGSGGAGAGSAAGAVAAPDTKSKLRFRIPRVRGPEVHVPKGALDAQGSWSAPVGITVISNFLCSQCAQANARLAQMKALYGEGLRISYRFEMTDDEGSLVHRAAEAGYCANDQNKFWDYKDALFAAKPGSEGDLIMTAYKLKLDTARFEKCFQERRYRAAVSADVQQMQKLGLSAPTLVINGEVVPGTESLENLLNRVESSL